MHAHCPLTQAPGPPCVQYAAKMLLPANLKLDSKAIQQLGLEGISEQHAQLASAAVLNRCICPCEATLQLLNIPIIQHSSKVHFVNTRPPEWTTGQVHGKGHNKFIITGSDALNTYANRPYDEPGEHTFEDLTLLSYFRNFEVGCIVYCNS